MLLGLHPLSSIEIKCVDGLLEAGRLHDQDDWRDFVNQWSTRMAQIVLTDVADVLPAQEQAQGSDSD
ncbi:hypothetical protein R1521_32965 [Rhizobium brockwellii]|uniref:Uncharacterized protein n=1 Tax=Rhizobium brockwellii TaxID=3019932 RepID=A0ABU3YWY6_9HYPH|nr:hypothetical protein [Rhizobium brockwellii]MDV4183313.1 hypothetical protein [Rhizobium brockwellii]MDV4190354.1 hypothetical protein [Rhizobium brockwellii]